MIIYRWGSSKGRFADQTSGKTTLGPKRAASPKSRVDHERCMRHHRINFYITNTIMSTTCQFAARRFALSARSSRASVTCKSSASYLQSRQTSSRRWASTEATGAASSNPKISTIVDQISQLTLLETADLVSTLKVGLFWKASRVRSTCSYLVETP